MTEQEKYTRLTLDEMMKRAEQVKEAKTKNATKELYVERLGGTIVIKKPSRNLIADTQSVETSEADAFLVYECVSEPPLKSKELQKTFGCNEPDEIVDKIFEPGEVTTIAKECLLLAGYGEDTVKEIEEIKNS